MTTYDDITARAQLSDRLTLMRDLVGRPGAAQGLLRPQPPLLSQPHALGDWVGTHLMRLVSRRAARPAA